MANSYGEASSFSVEMSGPFSGSGGAGGKYTQITLLSADWKNATSPYYQQVTVSGVSKTSKVDIVPTEEQIAYLGSLGIALTACNESGAVTIYAVGNKPDKDLTLDAALTDVTTSEKIWGNQVGVSTVIDVNDDLDMADHKITNLAAPEDSGDAVNKEYADTIKDTADNAKTAADNAKTAADNAQTSANNAKTAADNARSLANGKTAHKKTTVTLVKENWVNNSQSVSVDGVSPERVNIVGVDSSDFDAHQKAGVRCIGEGEGTLTFSCREVPETDLKMNVAIFDNSGNLGNLTTAEWEARILGGAS